MPLGVEHDVLRYYCKLLQVSQPLMPLGVEHKPVISWVIGAAPGESTFDAVRR